MEITTDVIKDIAELAQLEIPADQVEEVRNRLNRVLALVAEMEGAEIDDVAPLAHPLENQQIMRADTVTETDQRDRYQAVAPEVSDGLYLVPRVVE